MPAPYSPKAIANAILQRAFNDKKPVGHLKLQKLIYLAHGYHLAFTDGVPLIDELFEAWDYGPVNRSLYYEFRNFGKLPISRLATEHDWEAEDEFPVPAPSDDVNAQKVIGFVYSTYVDRDSFALSDLTHRTGWAWDRTRTADKFQLRNVDIQNELITEDFKPLVKQKAATGSKVTECA